MHITEIVIKGNINRADVLDPEKFKEIFASNRMVIYKMIAIVVFNDYIKSKFLSRLYAIWLSRNINCEQAYTIINMYFSFGGTNEFIQLMRLFKSIRYTAEGIIFEQTKQEV